MENKIEEKTRGQQITKNKLKPPNAQNTKRIIFSVIIKLKVINISLILITVSHIYTAGRVKNNVGWGSKHIFLHFWQLLKLISMHLLSFFLWFLLHSLFSALHSPRGVIEWEPPLHHAPSKVCETFILKISSSLECNKSLCRKC